MHDSFFPTHNHTWHVFALQGFVPTYKQKKHLRVSHRTWSASTPHPLPLTKIHNRTKTNHQTNTHLIKKKWDGKIPNPGANPSPCFFGPPIGPRCQTSPRWPPSVGLILPSSYGWIRPVPHHIAWWMASSWRWLVPWAAKDSGGGKARKVGRCGGRCQEEAWIYEWWIWYSFMESC